MEFQVSLDKIPFCSIISSTFSTAKRLSILPPNARLAISFKFFFSNCVKDNIGKLLTYPDVTILDLINTPRTK